MRRGRHPLLGPVHRRSDGAEERRRKGAAAAADKHAEQTARAEAAEQAHQQAKRALGDLLRVQHAHRCAEEAQQRRAAEQARQANAPAAVVTEQEATAESPREEEPISAAERQAHQPEPAEPVTASVAPLPAPCPASPEQQQAAPQRSEAVFALTLRLHSNTASWCEEHSVAVCARAAC